MLHRYSLSITERKRLLFLTRRRSISNCNFTNDILRQLLFQGFQRGILETHDLNCSVVCSDVHRDMIVILCKIWWIMVGMAWTGAPCPGFRHSHAPGQGGRDGHHATVLPPCRILHNHHHQRHRCSSSLIFNLHVVSHTRSPSCFQIVFNG